MSELENLQTHNLPMVTPESGDVVRVFRGTETAQCLVSDIGGGVTVVFTATDIVAVLGDSPPLLLAAPDADNVIAPLMFFASLQLMGGVGFGTGNWNTEAGPCYEDSVHPLAQMQGCLGDSADSRGPFPVDGILIDDSEIAGKALVLWCPEGTEGIVPGAIATSSVGSGGSGYLVGDTGTVPDLLERGRPPATYVVTGAPGGVVSAFTITFPGDFYDVRTDWPTENAGAQPGSGTGFTINTDTIDVSVNPSLFTVTVFSGLAPK